MAMPPVSRHLPAFVGAALAALGLAVGAALAAPGDLDPSFSGDGKLIRDVNGGVADAVAVDGQGRIVVAGNFDPPGGDVDDFQVARYLPGGALDTTFSGDGLASVDASGIGAADDPHDVAIDSQGRILVGGQALDATDFNLALARFLPTGQIDMSFGGGDGVQTDDIDLNDPDRIEDLVIDSAGRPVAVGSTGPTVAGDLVLARYSTTGPLDGSFGGGDGFETLNFNNVASDDSGTGLGIDSAGRFLVSGTTSIAVGMDNFAAARFTQAGILDPTFSNDIPTPGRVIVLMSSEVGGDTDDDALDLAVAAGDKPLLAGSAEITGASTDFALLRLTSAGAPDTSFSADGKAYASFGASTDDASELVIDGSGNAVLVGETDPTAGDSEFALARFTPTGALDFFWAENGLSSTDVGPGEDTAEALALDPVSGRIVASGFNGPFGTADWALARYQGVPRCGGKTPTIAGTSGNDALRGTGAKDVIWGGAGDDTLRGLGKADILCGDAGRDRLIGGKGRDLLLGGKGRDRLVGGPQRDKLRGGPGRDRQRQ